MCGISGIWYFDKLHTVDSGLLCLMTDQLSHRGPDQTGAYCKGPIALGARRLSIVDGSGSQQPITNENGSLVLVANGEIYNYRQLRLSNHVYHTGGDLEAIVHLYEDMGAHCVDVLRGMYAFALWDSHQCQLMLAVDRFGKKPLYYILDADKLVFASELKALRLYPTFCHDLDFVALDEYLAAGYITAPRTIYRNVRKLSPGQRLTVRQDGSLEADCYWSPEYAIPSQCQRRSPDDLAEELRVLLEDAVRLRLAADSPPGAFLSGGVDSSTVVALMTRLSGRPVKTFSLGFADPKYDESGYARSVAAHFQAEYRCEIIEESALDMLPALVRQFDEPFADASMLPTYLVARLARGEVRSVLSGDGGDEVFGGYHQHLYAYRQQFLEGKINAAFRPLVRRAAEKMPQRVRGIPYLAALDRSPEYWLANGFFSAEQRTRLYSWGMQSMNEADKFERRRHSDFERSSNRDLLSQVQYHDLTHYLPGDILVKVDRASMYASLEVRCPLLDHTLFEFVAELPASIRMSTRTGKSLLKRAMSPLLPAHVCQRRKQGFSIPQAEWLRTSLKPLVLDLASTGLLSTLFEKKYVEQLVGEHFSERVDHKDRLWALLCLDLWARAQ